MEKANDESSEYITNDDKMNEEVDKITSRLRQLTAEELDLLQKQAARPLAPNMVKRFEKDSSKHWDLFYKRHGGDFFRERHWAVHELTDLIALPPEANLLEAGCGAGAFLAGLIAAGIRCNLYGCDLSPRAVELLKSKPLLGGRVTAFRADLVSGEGLDEVSLSSMDVLTCVFLLSALSPERQKIALMNLYKLLRPGGVLYFRDYARYDMTQLRFKPGRMVYDNFYIRHDGTGSYFFEMEELKKMFLDMDFEINTIEYIERRTINKKENIDVPRYFLQAKVRKTLLCDQSKHIK